MPPARPLPARRVDPSRQGDSQPFVSWRVLLVVHRIATAVAALVVALVAAAPAAAQRDVPQSFYGVNYDADIAVRPPPDVHDQEFARQAESGVESTRVVFNWDQLQPSKRGTPRWSETDPVVERATRHGIELLPVVINAPRWARENRRSFHSPPKHPRDLARFFKLLIRRYGDDGSFWRANPDLSKRPLRTWQVWNEPHLRFQWDSDRDWARAYGAQLRWAYKAIKREDRGATVVMAAMSNRSWEYLREAYRRGRVRGHFDVAALHPYTSRARGVIVLAKRYRRVMRSYRDQRKRLWVTELGLPASKGRERSRNPLQTTDEGMADFLTTSMEKLVAGRRSSKIRVSRVYWYTWASVYCCGDIFRYNGLRAYDPRDHTLADKPAMSAYVESARRHQGCAKTSTGVCAPP